MRSRVIAALLVGLTPIVTAGCTSGDEPDAAPSGQATTDVPTTDTTDGTDATSATVTEPAAATGEQVQLKNTVRLRVPAQYDWLIDDGGDSILATAVVDGGLLDIAVNDVLDDGDSLDEAADIVLDTHDDDTSGTYRLADNRTVAGVEGFVIEGERDARSMLEFGTLHNGRLVRIDLEHPTSFDADLAAEIFASVLASVEWK